MSYLGNLPAAGTITNQYVTGNGSTTSFALNHEYGNEASVLVFLSGVKQKSDSYAVINGNIVFSTAPLNGVVGEFIFLGGAVKTTPYLSADTYGVIRINANIISADAEITAGYNASSAGALTVATGVTVTVATGAEWTIF